MVGFDKLPSLVDTEMDNVIPIKDALHGAKSASSLNKKPKKKKKKKKKMPDSK